VKIVSRIFRIAFVTIPLNLSCAYLLLFVMYSLTIFHIEEVFILENNLFYNIMSLGLLGGIIIIGVGYFWLVMKLEKEVWNNLCQISQSRIMTYIKKQMNI